jgi:ceramide glucosyltransferase
VSLAEWAAVATTIASLTLYGTMMALFGWAMLRRRRRPHGDVLRAPRITVFKPLAGDDDELEQNIESLASLDYPSFEILFGVASASDPALAIARRFAARHPRIAARVLLTDRDAAVNPKVAQLVCLERSATGEVYVISDSNVRVHPGYLWSMVTELEDERVGIVTGLFAGTGERTIGAALENLQICAASAPGMVAMDAVSDRPLTVGKSMAFRRRDLARLGGFPPVGDVLAEDYALGRRFLDAGFLAKTSLLVVENRNVGCSIARTLERHTRWTKMRRALLPSAFAFEPFLTPVVIATLALLLVPGRATAFMLLTSALSQTVCALACVRVLRGRALPVCYVPLEMARSYIAFFCWVRACASRRIDWRGHPFLLKRGTVIVPLADASQRRARVAA